MLPGIREVEAARQRLEGVVRPTQLIRSDTLDRMFDAHVYLKPENLQKTGSFKIRGAYNRVAALSADEAPRGVIAASAGNHGQALAFAASRAGVNATIVMPRTAAIAKIDATRSYGQQVVLEGADYQQAREAAEEIRRRTGALFVDAYDDPFVIAGQGTVGLEIAGEIKPEVVVVPVGGGGLIAGITIALAARVPDARVIGAEAAGSPQLSLSIAGNAPAAIERPADTIADGLATGRLGALPFAILRGRVGGVVTVDDFEIGEAALLVLERLKLLVEGAGAAALAAALKIKDSLRKRRVVILRSGGNIDITLLDRIIGHGLVKAGRLVRIEVGMSDRPGELNKLLAIISENGVNVRTIEHYRTRLDVPIGGARVMLELETRGRDQIEALLGRLRERNYEVAEDSAGR
jgi:threonine dehydratase